MLVLRIAAVLAAAAIGACLLAYLFSRDRRYLQLAWRIVKYGLIFLLAVLAMMALERVMAPLAPLV